MSKRSFYLFLYGTSNLFGCLWGAIGLIAYFAGIIHNYWLFIVGCLYGLGFLFAYMTNSEDSPVLEFNIGNQVSTKALKEALDQLIKKISKRLSGDELDKVRNIEQNILFLLPHINALASADQDLHIIKQTVVDYLPQTLSAYLELPPAFAKFHTLKNGKTAQQNLVEQLTVLDDQINQIVININSKNADALMVQGEFLKSKFSTGESWL